MSVEVLHYWPKQVLPPPTHLSSSRQRCHVSNGCHPGGVRAPLVCRFPRKWDRPSLLQRSRSCESSLSASGFIRRRRTSTARLFSFSNEASPENVDDDRHDDHDDSNAAESFSDEEIAENTTESFSDEEFAEKIDDDDRDESNATESFSGVESCEKEGDDDQHSNATEYFPDEESPENVDDDHHDRNATESFSDEEVPENINDDHDDSYATECFSNEEFAEKIDDNHDSTNATESFSGEGITEKEVEQLNPNQARILTEDDYVAYLRTESAYLTVLSLDPLNRLFLVNYAQFLYQFVGDYHRAELCFKIAAKLEEEVEMCYRDAEVYRKYGEFLWKGKKDLVAADIALFQAFRLEPNNTFFAGFYAHFLWITSSSYNN